MKKILLIAISLTQIILANENIENNTTSSNVIINIDEQRTISKTEETTETPVVEQAKIAAKLGGKKESLTENKMIDGFIKDPIEGLDNIKTFCITKKSKGSNDEDITIKKDSSEKEQALEDYNKMVLESDLDKEKYGRIDIHIESEDEYRDISTICVMNKIKSTQSTHKKIN